MSMIAAIVARLEATKAQTGLKRVGGAAAFQAAVETNPAAVPAAYVFTLDETAGPNPVAPDVIQRVSASIGVVLVARNLSDAKGAAAGQDMETLRAAVKAVLLGWSPAEGHDPLERGRAHLLAFRDGHMWWQDAYTTAYFDRSTL
jgi:hypothetical protein